MAIQGPSYPLGRHGAHAHSQPVLLQTSAQPAGTTEGTGPSISRLPTYLIRPAALSAPALHSQEVETLNRVSCSTA